MNYIQVVATSAITGELVVSIQSTPAGFATQGAIANNPCEGQILLAVTNSVTQLPSNALANGVIITAKSTNAADIHIGGPGVNNVDTGTGNGYILEPGNSVSAVVNNTNELYIIGTVGDLISFIGS
jgi:hypothetical protein